MSRFASRMDRVRSSPIMELLKKTAGGDYISFASGLPDPALFPVDALRDLCDQVLSKDGAQALQYDPAEGYGPLREWVAQKLTRQGLAAAPEQVLITQGSQQALELTSRLFLDRGDEVLLDSPSYLAAIQAFDSCQAGFMPVPVDDSGMDAAEAAALMRTRQPRLLFTLPNFQNPTGTTLPLARRRVLAEAAAAAGVAVLEDDAYHDLRYDGQHLPPLCALAENPSAVYTGTFSKTIAPGLRVGYLYSSAANVERLAQLKQLTDLHTNSLSQRLAYGYCTSGQLEPHVELLRRTYSRRRDVMLSELQRHLAGAARWTSPEGGMFLFLTLPETCDAESLLETAMERGVVFVPGSSFYPVSPPANTLRLNFVSAGEEAIVKGIKILSEVILAAV